MAESKNPSLSSSSNHHPDDEQSGVVQSCGDTDEPPCSGFTHHHHHHHQQQSEKHPKPLVIDQYLADAGQDAIEIIVSIDQENDASQQTTSHTATSDLLQPHSLSVEQTVQQLQSNIITGLDADQVKVRLQIDGPNQLKQATGVSVWTILFRQVANAMTLVLVAAMALSFGVRDYIEGSVVTAVIAANVFIGFVQEYKAEKTMASLRSLTSPTASVLRSCHIDTVPSKHLVAGDIVDFRTGDLIPADVRLISISNLEIDEAPLTGESMPVIKTIEALTQPDLGPADRTNMGYSGTTVTRGRGKGIVTATGMDTQIGQIAQQLASKPSSDDPSLPAYKRWWNKVTHLLGMRQGTPLQIKLNKFAYILLVLAILCALIVFSVAEFDMNDEVVLYAIALGIGVIPESLIAVVTITFSVGAKRMAESNVVVRRMDALEALGGVTDICSDKTGTLTQGKMIVRKGWLFGARRTFGVEQAGKSAFEPQGRIFQDTDDEEIKIYQDAGSVNEKLKRLGIAASLCNVAELELTRENEWTARGDPTEIALLVFAHKLQLGRASLTQGEKPAYVFDREYAFDSTIKRMTTMFKLNGDTGDRLLFMKGAVERVLDCCTSVAFDNEETRDGMTTTNKVSLDKDAKQLILEQMAKMASEGLRVIAFAERKMDQAQFKAEQAKPHEGSFTTLDGSDQDSFISDKNFDKVLRDEGGLERTVAEREFEFLGLVALYDPPRPDTKAAVEACQQAGIVVHMLTGDHPETAAAIAREVSIIDGSQGKDAVMTATRFDNMTDEEIDALEQLPLVIARCSPTTKVRMIAAGKRRQRYVAMTGDGINDAPSLKQAPIGIGMGSGTDVAKESCDMILTDDRFNSIVKGIREGRAIFDNIQRFLIGLLVANVAEVLLLLCGLAVRDADQESVFPLTPVAILWVNMVTASFPAIGLGLEPGEADIMQRPPHDLKAGVLSRAVIVDTLVYGTMMGSTCLLSFLLMLFPVGGGRIALDCNHSSTASCQPILQARSAVFTTLTLELLLICWELISMEKSFFSMSPVHHLWRNPMLLWSVVAGIATIPICLYVPTLNTKVFRHAAMNGTGWGVSLGMTVLFLITVELWKLVARRGKIGWLARISGGQKGLDQREAKRAKTEC